MKKTANKPKSTGNATKSNAKEKTALENLVCTNTALRLAARRLGNLYDDALAPTGLKATQVSLLSEIERMSAANDGLAPTLQDLAIKLAIQISALTHALKPLIRDGIVRLLADEQDKRTKRAALTATGVACLNQAIAYWAFANQRVEDILGSESATALRAIADFVASDDFMSAYIADKE